MARLHRASLASPTTLGMARVDPDILKLCFPAMSCSPRPPVPPPPVPSLSLCPHVLLVDGDLFDAGFAGERVVRSGFVLDLLSPGTQTRPGAISEGDEPAADGVLIIWGIVQPIYPTSREAQAGWIHNIPICVAAGC